MQLVEGLNEDAGVVHQRLGYVGLLRVAMVGLLVYPIFLAVVTRFIYGSLRAARTFLTFLCGSSSVQCNPGNITAIATEFIELVLM